MMSIVLALLESLVTLALLYETMSPPTMKRVRVMLTMLSFMVCSPWKGWTATHLLPTGYNEGGLSRRS